MFKRDYYGFLVDLYQVDIPDTCGGCIVFITWETFIS